MIIISFMFPYSLGAIADLDLVVCSKDIKSDIMVVSSQGIPLQTTRTLIVVREFPFMFKAMILLL